FINRAALCGRSLYSPLSSSARSPPPLQPRRGRGSFGGGADILSMLGRRGARQPTPSGGCPPIARWRRAALAGPPPSSPPTDVECGSLLPPSLARPLAAAPRHGKVIAGHLIVLREPY